MRVPMRLGDETVNPYLATRATLLLTRDDPRIKSIAFPGMGTGVGGVSAEICARQMRAALIDSLGPAKPMPSSWAEASENHQDLYGAAPRNLQFG